MRRTVRWLAASAALASTSIAAADPETEGCPPWCPVPHVPEHVSPNAKGRWGPGFAMRTLSLRFSEERTHIGDGDRSAGGAGVEERALAYLSLGKVNARYTDFLALGGGSGGFDGGLGIDAAIGYEPLFGDRHGPFARVGIRAHTLYGQHFHTSVLELPQMQLGYSYIRHALQLEAGARTGPVLTGRYGVEGGTTTSLGGSFELGGYVALGARPVRLDVEASRVRLDPGPEGPVESLEALLCGALARPNICLRVSGIRATLAGAAGPTRATAAYLGLTVGIGPAEWR